MVGTHYNLKLAFGETFPVNLGTTCLFVFPGGSSPAPSLPTEGETSPAGTWLWPADLGREAAPAARLPPRRRALLGLRGSPGSHHVRLCRFLLARGRRAWAGCAAGPGGPLLYASVRRLVAARRGLIRLPWPGRLRDSSSQP